MKRKIAVLLSAIMVASCVLSGCSLLFKKSSQTEKASETESFTERSVDSTSSEAQTSNVSGQFNRDNFMKVVQEDGYFYVYKDEIPGHGIIQITPHSIEYRYVATDEETFLGFIIDPISVNDSSMRIDFQLEYKDHTCFAGYVEDVGLKDFWIVIDQLVELKADKYVPIEVSAMDDHAEQIKADIPILYSRFIAVAENAFKEQNLGIEDLGIEFGNKYRSLDQGKMMSMEEKVEIPNEHKFKNGICSDCGMTWREYFYNALEELDENTKPGEWHSIYGKRSSSMLTPESDFVQLSAPSKDICSLTYHRHVLEDQGEDFEVGCVVEGDKIRSNLKYNFEQAYFSVGPGVDSPRFVYSMDISADLGEYDKVFASKESLKEHCKIYFFRMNSSGSGEDIWSTVSHDEIKNLLEKSGCIFYSEDELIDLLWERHTAFLESIDKSLEDLNTTLADAGINWK